MINYVGWMLRWFYKNWKLYVNRNYQVRLQYPPNWIRLSEERYQGRDGFFQVSAAESEDGLAEVCRREAFHKLKPYGSKPKLRHMRHRGQEACLILPSDDQPREMKGQAAFIVEYPKPVTVDGQTYRFLVLWVDKDHIRKVVNSLRFL